MERCHLLVVEDNPDINTLLCRLLTRDGYRVSTAFSGSEAKMCLDRYNYDLIILDLMLPGMTGEALVTEIRKNKTVPIIIVSAKTAVEDRIHLLKSGADDFISKPFDLGEVSARVEAQLRRFKSFSTETPFSKTLNHKNMVLYPENIEAFLNDMPLSLTLHEFGILKLLMSYPKKVFTRENLFTQVWNDAFLSADNTINVHISNLRSKIAKIDPDTPYIKTVWGIGFKMAD